MAPKHLLVQSCHHSLVRISPLEIDKGHSDVPLATLNQYMIIFGKHTETADKLLPGQTITTQYLLVQS